MKNKAFFPLSSKFALTFVTLKVFTMIIVAYAVHTSVVFQFTNQYNEKVEHTARLVHQEMRERAEKINIQLKELAAELKADSKYHLYVNVLNDPNQRYVIEYAEKYMNAMQLDVLEIVDARGTIFSSGQFPQETGSSHPLLIKKIAENDNHPVLTWFHRPEDSFLSLVSMDSIHLGPRLLYLIGGVEINQQFLDELLQDSSIIILLQKNNSVLSTSNVWDFNILPDINLTDLDTSPPEWIEKKYTVGHYQIPVIQNASLYPITIYFLYPRKELNNLLDRLRRNILAITAVGILIAITLSFWRTRAVAEPLMKLANKAGSLSLEKLNINFNYHTNDEIGILNDALARMVKRLRQSRLALARAEKKAAQAEITRQINHDIKNGFLPIRNIMHHWEEVARDDPSRLVEIFNERKGTVLESLQYLEDMTKRYTGLQNDVNVSTIEINQMITTLVDSYRDLPDRDIEFDLDLNAGNPKVLADPVQLRRAFENIVNNALEAMGVRGIFRISTSLSDGMVIIRWEDSGTGIPEAIMEHLFKKPITNKSGGSGIGLFTVMRIVKDYSGSVSVESKEGIGTTVRLQLPVYVENKGEEQQK